MPDKGSENRKPSLFFRFKKHISSVVSPSPPVSPCQRSQGQFNGAHDFVMHNPVLNDYSTTTVTDNFLKDLLQQTIIGAEFDSSDRDPPPRCHPGTRLKIIQRCLDFIEQCQDEGKLRWVVGPAGVGKSAVMQMVIEQAPDAVVFVSIFLSVNGRRDGTKTILTIAYQLAVKCGRYRQFIQDQINLDPSLLRKSLSVQFKAFIVEPFMLKRIFEPSVRFLVAIDGLDECNSIPIQQKLLELITHFCIAYPTSPIAWIVASRPEPHITSFFAKDEIKPAYTKEEIKIDSDEACEDVQRCLRDELKKIQSEYPTLRRKREWPSEHEFTMIASAAGGLFAYAATVVRYIGDPRCRNPAAQLCRVLEVIAIARTKEHIAGNDHPMAQLYALYERILSGIPANAMINTKKLLAGCFIWCGEAKIFFNGRLEDISFRPLCNRLGLTEDDAYGAICHLDAVMMTPEPHKADEESLNFHHKSFRDFLSDSKRLGFSDDFADEARQICVQASLGIVREVPHDSDSVASGEDIGIVPFGSVKSCCDNIALSWPGDERFQMGDHQLRIELYSCMMARLCFYNASDYDEPYMNISWFHALTTRFTVLGDWFPFHGLRDSMFGNLRHELTELGKLKQVPLWALDYAAIFGFIDLEFTSPIETDVELSDPWNPSCSESGEDFSFYSHRRKEIGDLQQRRGWSTSFRRYYQVDSPTKDMDFPRFHTVTCQKSHEMLRVYFGDSCIRCSRRLARHLMNNQDLLATVFVDGTQLSYVEVSFVDPDDGVSEWRYRFLHSGRPTSIDA